MGELPKTEGTGRSERRSQGDAPPAGRTPPAGFTEVTPEELGREVPRPRYTVVIIDTLDGTQRAAQALTAREAFFLAIRAAADRSVKTGGLP